MQCGFGMLEAGAVTARGTQNILLKNLLDASISAVVWYSFGYGLAFGGENPFIGNPLSASDSSSSSSNSNLFLVKLLEEDATGFSTPNSASGYAWAFWWFQFVRAAPRRVCAGAACEWTARVVLRCCACVVAWPLEPGSRAVARCRRRACASPPRPRNAQRAASAARAARAVRAAAVQRRAGAAD
jgi:ammonia channel protein AmtB